MRAPWNRGDSDIDSISDYEEEMTNKKKHYCFKSMREDKIILRPKKVYSNPMSANLASSQLQNM